MEDRLKRREVELQRIIREKRIENDYDMAMVINKLIQDPLPTDDDLKSLVLKYHLTAHQRNIRVISLDGGGNLTEIMVSSIQIVFLL